MLSTTMRALVIEDGSKMAALLRRGLQEEGFAVDVAANGEDGSWLGAENDYDVILLDVMLPDVDGFEVCRRPRAGDRWARSSCSRPGTASRTAWRAGRRRPRLPHEAAAHGAEIRLNDGSVVDVALDANFHVIGDVSNDEGAVGEEGAADQNGGDED